MSGDSDQTSFLKFYGSKMIMLFFKKDLADKNSCFNFAPVLCDSLIKKGRGIWPDDALATGNVLISFKGANSILVYDRER